MLKATIQLHMLKLVKENLSWYLISGAISEAAAAAINDDLDQAVKAYVPHMNTALAGLGLPDNANRSGSISRDYVAYNSQPDAENFESAGPLFDFRQTGNPRPRL